MGPLRPAHRSGNGGDPPSVRATQQATDVVVHPTRSLRAPRTSRLRCCCGASAQLVGSTAKLPVTSAHNAARGWRPRKARPPLCECTLLSPCSEGAADSFGAERNCCAAHNRCRWARMYAQRPTLGPTVAVERHSVAKTAVALRILRGCDGRAHGAVGRRRGTSERGIDASRAEHASFPCRNPPWTNFPPFLARWSGSVQFVQHGGAATRATRAPRAAPSRPLTETNCQMFQGSPKKRGQFVQSTRRRPGARRSGVPPQPRRSAYLQLCRRPLNSTRGAAQRGSRRPNHKRAAHNGTRAATTRPAHAERWSRCIPCSARGAHRPKACSPRGRSRCRCMCAPSTTVMTSGKSRTRRENVSLREQQPCIPLM